MITQYLEATKFESIMTSAMREVFEGDLIPKKSLPKTYSSIEYCKYSKRSY